MLPKGRAPAKDYFSEPKRKRKMTTIREKVKLVSGLNKTENTSNFCVLLSSIFREVSFREYWLQRRRKF